MIIGGFLGAGKTTAMLRLAQYYHSTGRRPGLITNDQAARLVDTGMLQFHGFRVEEVAGACFCCKFNDLVESARRLRREERPGVLLAEPVGGCTDLAATVVRPLSKYYGDHYTISPYSVLVDPERARKIVLEKSFGGFSSKVAYVFLKQLGEADVILLNKIDTISKDAREILLNSLRLEFPKARILAISAATGEGFDEWRAVLEGTAACGANITDVDYDIYAEGEAELGWLNAIYHISARTPVSADAFVKDVIFNIGKAMRRRGAEIAHLKAIFTIPGGASVANDTGSPSGVQLSKSCGGSASDGTLTINARVHLDPESIYNITISGVDAAAAAEGAKAVRAESYHFRPGRPVPTHRFAADL